jgi:hypothetical protein
MPQQNIFERAFELARSGQCRSMDEMRRKLKAEQFENVDGHLSGGTIKRQLADAMKMLD